MSNERQYPQREASREGGRWQALVRLLGIEQAPVTHVERLLSMAGAIAAIYALGIIERDFLGETGAAMLVASMGASAVLLFAVPHGALSQPWPVLGGHIVSAVVGVACAKFVADQMLAAALAVGLAILAMHYLRAIHPPGGATALTAVIGGQQIEDLGFTFVVTPVLLNAFALVAAAVLLNAAFTWRRYPAAWSAVTRKPPAPDEAPSMTHADFVAALSEIGTFVDVSEDEFLTLRKLMRDAAAQRRIKSAEIVLGAYYSNGAAGGAFAVRRVIDTDQSDVNGAVIWRCVAGAGRNDNEGSRNSGAVGINSA